MQKKYLRFTDLKTGYIWFHHPDDWILSFCNFNSNIHPSLLKYGQTIIVKDSKGNDVEIKRLTKKELENVVT
jgi:hypothetical protein